MTEISANSTLITYETSLTAFGSPNGTVVLDPPLQFGVSDIRKLRLIRASISSSIANIYQSGMFNNALVRVSRDGGATWADIQMPNGVYTMHLIQKCINETLEDYSWWADPTDPGFILEYNLATQYTYFTLDSTKLAAPGTQLAIDFGQSRICEVLGFSAVKAFNVDGLYSADQQAQLDWTGNNVSLQISGLGYLSYRNGLRSEEICQIPLSTAQVLNEYTYPSAGIPAPFINCFAPQRLDRIQVTYVGTRYDLVGQSRVYRPIMLLEGQASVTLQLAWM